ncbi:hypothetical protein [Geodermatophilus sp. SYSU D00815]
MDGVVGDGGTRSGPEPQVGAMPPQHAGPPPTAWAAPAADPRVTVSWTAPAVPAAPSPGARRTRARLVALVAAALLAGLVLGAAGGVVGADDQDRVDALDGQVAGLEQQVADLRQEVDDTRDAAAADVAAARDEAEAEVAADNAARQAELDARAAELDQREAAVAGRESAVTVLEQQAADGSIPGDGLYLVPDEVAPGTYRARNPGEHCYWERLSGLSGTFEDLIVNGLGPADATVAIPASDAAFSTEGCGTWQRIG